VQALYHATATATATDTRATHQQTPTMPEQSESSSGLRVLREKSELSTSSTSDTDSKRNMIPDRCQRARVRISNQTDSPGYSPLPSTDDRQNHFNALAESSAGDSFHRGDQGSSNIVSRMMPELAASPVHNDTKLGKLLCFIDPYIVLLIFVNSVMIGVGTFDFVTENEKVSHAFEVTDRAFLITFTVEVVLNLFHFCRLDRLHFGNSRQNDDSSSSRNQKSSWYPSWLPKLQSVHESERRKRAKEKPWLIFDVLIIIVSWAMDGEGPSIFRAFRILRAVRLLSKVRSLKNLSLALLHVVPKMGALGFITCILFILIGIMVTLLFNDLKIADNPYEVEVGSGELSYDYFGDIPRSMLTLFQMMTFDNWHEPVREVMETKVWAWTIFVPWVFISGFVIVNLIIAIVCESLVKLDQQGVKAMHGEEILLDEFSIRDASRSSSNGKQRLISQRLAKLETALLQMLEDEVKILEEVEKMKKI